MPFVYNIVYLAGCIDFFFLVYWCCSSKKLEFLKRLRKSSTGVGTLKKSKQVMQRKNVAVAIGSVCSLVVFMLILADVVGVIHLLPKTSMSVPRICFCLLSLFVALFSTPAAHSTVFCYAGSVSAEFEVIDKDFATDANKHQLPVARHYIRGHGQLLRVAWCSAHIVLNFVAVYNILCLLYAFEYDLANAAQLFRLCFVLVAMMLQSICIFHMALKLRKWMVGMRAPMMRVAAGDHLPHEQVLAFSS
ncbi:unnamed protein product [Heligmosomoides polygyrus]|uniref:G_PROTEIN_RECEP_F1_2 domain-containing protein n=1 Tax=Heligmosomoides polygyrus TaxID=6339 RepID=A0A183FGK1_HELPZ|nr:unnamed protein product [Heligmosomoides polygyrus]